MQTIGVVGLGVVGHAFREGMKHAFRVLSYDLDPVKSDTKSIAELVGRVDGPIVIAVPTPMKLDGTCSLVTIETVLAEMDACGSSFNTIAVIKSTVPPGTCSSLVRRFRNVDIVSNPEFLTEKTPVEDFKNQKFALIGAPSSAWLIAARKVAEMYRTAYPNLEILIYPAQVTELAKYVINCFLATKVSFANEVYQVCKKLGISYDEVRTCISLDPRLGQSHWLVPGPDGHLGFGLSCFPKDINALIRLAQSLGVDPKVLRAAWEKNLEVRPERDWEQLKGRAVVE